MQLTWTRVVGRNGVFRLSQSGVKILTFVLLVDHSVPIIISYPLSHCTETHFGKGFNVCSNLMWVSSLIQSFSFYTGNLGDFQAHGIENALAAYTHKTHGTQLAILLPAYYSLVCHDDEEMFAREVIGVKDHGLGNAMMAEEGVEAMREFIRVLQLPLSFGEVGIEVTDEVAKAVSEVCAVSTTNPRTLTREEIYHLIVYNTLQACI